MRGFAFDQFGRLGRDARLVVDRLVDAGERQSGAHPDDLRRELLAAVGAAVNYAMAARYARAGIINHDNSSGVPNMARLNAASGVRCCRRERLPEPLRCAAFAS